MKTVRQEEAADAVEIIVPTRSITAAWADVYMVKIKHICTQKVILTKHDIFVQCGLKISSKTMKHRVTGHRETQTLISVVVHI